MGYCCLYSLKMIEKYIFVQPGSHVSGSFHSDSIMSKVTRSVGAIDIVELMQVIRASLRSGVSAVIM